MVNISEGFDFLGWNFRKLQREDDDQTCQEERLKNFLAGIRQLIDSNKTATQEKPDPPPQPQNTGMDGVPQKPSGKGNIFRC
ncbi:hypothetical protein [Thiothrix fructosivorans]|uniref:hypothetical protein n=1 Tax=Thiothrix fructosivorans TaxID=111770 RepID=UPI001F5FF1BC|nr:hypothetical protein [Thiothrix fructosivorans]